MRGAALVIALLLGAASGPAPAGAGAPPPPPAAPQLPSLAATYREQFLVGAAVTRNLLQDPRGEALVLQQFAALEPENELKPGALARGPGRYDFAAADALVDWALRHGMKVRGHCLVWYREAPDWMFKEGGAPLPREKVVERLRTYIHDVVGHFKGRVWAWDVVNEAFVPWEPGAPSVEGWRKSPWYDALGPEYVALAFRFAQEADPGALLFYNDYETGNPTKRDMIVALVKDLRARGIRIDGVGHQAHVGSVIPDPAELEGAIKTFGALGLRNHITELDVGLAARFGDQPAPSTPELVARQAGRWAEYFRMFRRNARSIDAVLTWGVNDEASWLGAPQAPLLFSRGEPKPAFWAVIDAAKGPP